MKATRLFTLFLVLCAGIENVLATNAPEDAWRYTVMLFGTDQLKLEMPCYDDTGYDSWVDKGYVYITIEGGDRETLFYYKSNDKSGDFPDVWGYKGVDGDMVLERDQNYSTINVTNVESKWEIPKVNGTNYSILRLTWNIPDKYRGKTVKISWNIHKTGNGPLGPAGEESKDISISDKNIQIPDIPALITPSVQSPMLGYDVAHAGQMVIVYTMPSNSIKSLTAYYTEVNGADKLNRLVTLDPNVSGYIYLPIDRCYKDFYIEAVYEDSEKKIRTTHSIPFDLAMLHHAAGLNVSLHPNGKVDLSWTIPNSNWEDFMSNDYWEIQRCTSGVPAINDQWTTIGQLTYSASTKQYTVTDENLISVYEGKPVYYRVRRTCTSLWDWAPGTFGITQLPATLHLPSIQNATVGRKTWTDTQHSVDFNFTLGTTGLTVKEDGLAYDSNGNAVLSSAKDWNIFASLVNSGKGNLNAIMAADIDLGDTLTMVGTYENPYKATFNGNGHTLKFNPVPRSEDDSVAFNEEYAAPFRYVSKATFRNLHVTGSISSSRKFIGSIVGLVFNDKVTIENCRSSVRLISTVKGDATNGGFVARADKSYRIEIKDCLFDGSFEGPECSNNGGFVGWSTGGVYVSNSLFAPTNITTLTDGCENFARTSSDGYVTAANSYCLKAYKAGSGSDIIVRDSQSDSEGRIVINNTGDWFGFVDRVKNANGGEVNVVLNADITVYNAGIVGTAEAPFHGTIEGNGHTLTVGLTFPYDEFVAPISYGKDYTIRNLHVTGKVLGDVHASGLVGKSSASSGNRNYIQNCRVSTEVTCNSTHAGGFIGHGFSTSHTITNCLFDGTLDFYYGGQYGGAIIGWEDGGSSNIITNCLEHGSYKNVSHAGMNYNRGTAYGNINNNKNNWSFQSWSETNNVGKKTPDELVKELSFNNWSAASGQVLPTMYKSMLNDQSLTALRQSLGSKWSLSGGCLMPIMATSDNLAHVTTLWDNRAKVILKTEKYGEKDNSEPLYTERRELTKEEVVAGHFTQQLNTQCVKHRFTLSTEQGTSTLPLVNPEPITPTKVDEDKDFEYTFNNNVKLTSIKADTLQTAVTLTWGSTGLADYYRIIRQDQMTQKIDTLADMFNQTTFMDRTPQPQHAYIYTVEGVTECEGFNVSSLNIIASCEPTGMVRGYLRLVDGTAMAGVTIKATPKTGNFVGAVEKTTVTNEAGFFEISGLIYQGSATYEISVEATGEMQAIKPLAATFDDTRNLITNLNFTQSNYYRFSGLVAYEGTSVPVVGAQFERDGAIVTNGSGQPIISDSQGRFTISIPQGTHTVRVVKDGHVFVDDGFYINEDDAEQTKHNWQREVSEYVFWDKTRVTLRGRVVGGDVQGELPLGQSLSRNNLGDSITIVMQLEGDNASYLVRDQLNANISELHQSFGVGPTDSCRIDVYRHRLVIHPDTETGEYAVPMIPVKFKVTEVYAQGYATLFQAGEVGQTIDLTTYSNGDIATWNRIYHATPTLSVKQYNMTGEDYFGIKQYADMDNTGKNYTIELWNDSTGYSFGHPIFMAGSPVVLMLAAVEQYYWNNDNKQYIPDVVHLHGGRVHIENGLVSTTETQTLKLDSIGEAIYSFVPQNLTFTQEGDMALKVLTINMEYDSTYYDIKPFNGNVLSGYILASKAIDQGKRIVSDGGICLIDILRDPPGSGSSAYIESGTKLNYSFTQSVTTKAGVNLSINRGGGNSWYNGVWAGTGAGQEVGQINTVNSTNLATLPIVATYYNNWQYNYTFETTERISTATGQTAVGREADVFIGMTRNAILEDAIAVRAISDETYQLLTTHEGGTFSVNGLDFRVRQGTMKVLAKGKNSNGQKVWIVRDEVLRVSTCINSTFVHSQSHIEQEIIPNLIKVRNSLILPLGTSETKAQEVADFQGFPIYISKVGPDADNFATLGFYEQIDPKGKEGLFNDSIQILNHNILTWINFLAVNEREKVEATDLVKSYDVDGRTSVSYNEAFTLAENESRYFLFPLIQGTGGLSTGSFGVKSPKTSTNTEYAYGQDNGMHIDINTFGTSISIKMNIVASLDYNYNYGKGETTTKKVGFTLAPSTKSNITLDVYHTQANSQILDQRRAALLDEGYSEDDIQQMLFMYASEDFIKNIKLGENKVPGTLGGMCSYMTSSPQMYRGLVFRTRGGATSAPYEDERLTKYYNAGTLLDAKTVEIDRLRIWADEQTVSNVPYDEPARFTIHMANESESPALATEVFTYFLNDTSNAKGAKIQIEGVPLSGSGSAVFIPSGTIVTKKVELYPGAEFDYDNVGICLYDPNDRRRVQRVNLSAHFVPTAGKVNISLPGDKWVINTESQLDTRLQQYYMPVIIDGFDVNYRGFDHIELQYKLSNQGDKEWVNVCSFYKDSLLMSKASGVCQLINDDGRIVANFFGESDPIEQQYDLRAVSYCRHGGGFLTRSSDIISGIKDTRRPQLFGTPKPEDGILGIGDDIIMRFSEKIAGNYLRELNNFQVVGQTNSSNITFSTNLHFISNGTAETQSSRNLMGKSFTVDVMLNPNNNGKAMSFFTHGENDYYLELGLTADQRLMAALAQTDTAYTTNLETMVYTSTEPISFNGLTQVIYTFENDIENQTTTISFYNGTKQIGSFVHPHAYNGSGKLVFGQIGGLVPENTFYEGEMLEFRLWSRVLTTSEMADYSFKRLTGYERGLLDNFPLNEGKGEYSYNRVKFGSDLILMNTTWKTPDGIGMKLDGEKGFRLASDKFQRWNHQDYSLMFWFNTRDDNGTLLANGKSETEPEYSEHFNFNVKEGSLFLQLGGREILTKTTVNDGQWHHAALTICRSRNMGCLYLDQQLYSTFAVDTIGGINGNNLAAGATYDGTGISNTIHGYIDEIAMFEMALPENGIKNFANTTPTGEEMGLLAYLNFSHNELQQNNQQRLMPTGVSLKRYKDFATGQLTAQRDTIVNQEDIERLADRSIYAPMNDTQTLENIKYSFVADGKDLLINLDVPEERIEKTNLYIVVRDVADLQGNLMASPVVMDLYVYRNPLRWNIKRLSLTPKYGEKYVFEATIQNLSGKTRRYSLEGLPIWITASQLNGSIGALDEETITFTISPYINIGDFDEIVSLIGEEGMIEPLPINIKVRGEKPSWTVDQALMRDNITMNIIAQVEIDGHIMNDPDDRIAVFGEGHRTLGVAQLDADPNNANGGTAYLTVYNSTTEETPLHYEFFDASTGIIHVLMGSPEVNVFKHNTVVGTPENPYLFNTNNGMVQTMHLHEGWNWISFNVTPINLPVGQLLNNATQWEVGDGLEVIRPDGTYAQIAYKQFYNADDPKNPIFAWDEADKVVELDPQQMYRFYSHSDKLAYISGFSTFEEITVKPGWNRIGYLSFLNLPLGTALADYTDKAVEGDIIKSQSQFAILTIDSDGNKMWRGTLQYMQTGEGYMLKRNSTSKATFHYPSYYGHTRYNNYVKQLSYINTSGTSMTVVARAKGIETQEGDVLTALRGADICGLAVADSDGVFYLNIGDVDAAGDEIMFTLERNEEVIAQADNRQMRYTPNAALGTPKEPTPINFVSSGELYGEGWYTVSGVKLNKRPHQAGVYIYNNEKVLIK